MKDKKDDEKKSEEASGENKKEADAKDTPKRTRASKAKEEKKDKPSKRTRSTPTKAKKEEGESGGEQKVEEDAGSEKEGSGDDGKGVGSAGKGRGKRARGSKKEKAEEGETEEKPTRKRASRVKKEEDGEAKEEEDGNTKPKRGRKPRKPRSKKEGKEAAEDGAAGSGGIEVRRGEVDLNEGILEDPDVVDDRFKCSWDRRCKYNCFEAWHTSKIGLAHDPLQKGWGVRAFEKIKGGEQLMIIPAKMARREEMEPIEDYDKAYSLERREYRIRAAAVADPDREKDWMWSYVDHYDDWDNFYTRMNHGSGRSRNATELEWAFQVDGEDRVGMGLFATRDIDAGDEILIDYRTNTPDFVSVFPWLGA